MLKRKGFTLIEILVAVAVFALVSAGIYATISYVYKLTYLSRVKVLATQVANEKIEVIRNLPYEQAGTIGGVPNGILPQTETIVRDGINFLVNTTIRNIDDPFDGVIGGAPNDTSPADYKLVEVRIFCTSCVTSQIQPVVLSTHISPKGLESASQNGSLFIKVFDAAGLPVPAVSLQITNTKINPSVNISDVTNANGEYYLIDTATSTEGYKIQASKVGYSVDYTVEASEANPNPLKPPATVVSQTVTNISFSIDKVSAINLSSINYQCLAIPSIGFKVSGSKTIGTNPNVYKYSQDITTNGSGLYQLNNLEWDTYNFSLNSSSYDLAGAIPVLPLSLNPDSTQDLLVVLQPHSTNSLLITVKDSGTKLSLSNATTTLTKGSTTLSSITGRGYWRQTDWSGGGGQEAFIDETKYLSQDGNVEMNDPAGDLLLKKLGGKYYWNGLLISSTIDFGLPTNFTNIIWEPLAQPPQAGADSLKFQIATSPSSTPASWNFSGPDGTGSTYYTISDANINPLHNNDRYLRYKVFLNTENQNFTPQLSEIAFNFTSGCTPPGQSFFSELGAGAYNLKIELPGYQTVETTVDVSGRTQIEVMMSP